VLGSVVLAIVAAACGGGGLSMEDYFSKMDDLQSSFEQQTLALQTEVQATLKGVSSDEEALSAFKGFLEKSLVAVNDQLSKFEALDPPSEAASAHMDLIEAGEKIRSALMEVLDRYEEFGTLDEVSQVFTTDFADAGQQGDDACNELQAVADDNDIDVDLGCA
jgi:hypothetical protein